MQNVDSNKRYSRQELFSGIGKEGQQKIRSAIVAIVGCGALGSLLAEVMTRAGVGKIILIDRDFVEYVNLQRQALFIESDAAQSIPKAIAATNHLREINRDVEVVPVVADLNPDSVSVISDAQLILDGTDNFQTRYLMNDLAWKSGIPWIYGACVSASGIAAAFVPDAFPCLRCLFDTEPPVGSSPTCDTAGIIWPAVGAVVSYQVAAAFKFLTQASQRPELLQLDVWEGHYHVVSLEKAKRSDCMTCGQRKFPSLFDSSELDTSLCGRDAVQIRPRKTATLDLDAIAEQWKLIGESFRNPFLAKLILEKNEIVLFPDGRAIIKGTSEFSRARDLYAKYVGI